MLYLSPRVVQAAVVVIQMDLRLFPLLFKCEICQKQEMKARSTKPMLPWGLLSMVPIRNGGL